MRLSPTISHIGEVRAVVRTGRIPHPGNLFPLGRINCGEIRVALGPGVHFGNFQAIGNVHPLRNPEQERRLEPARRDSRLSRPCDLVGSNRCGDRPASERSSSTWITASCGSTPRSGKDAGSDHLQTRAARSANRPAKSGSRIPIVLTAGFWPPYHRQREVELEFRIVEFITFCV